MGSPYLNSNETIILSTHNVVINTIPAEAILTSQRLILVDARHTSLRPQDIPFGSLETVTIGDNTAMDPVLSLSVVLPDETRHTLGIVFPQVPKQKRTGERDEWATKLKEASLSAQKDGSTTPAELLPPWVAGDLPEDIEAGDKDTANEEENIVRPPLALRKPRTKAPSGSRRKVIMGGLAIVLIAACIGAVYFLSPSFAGSLPSATPVTTTPATTIPTVTPTPVATVQPVETTPEISIITTIPTPEATTTPAPQLSGVWVRIQYTGDYSATYGTSGSLREVTSRGEQYYQIPAKDEIVEATVQKLDASGDLLTVTIYNNGVPTQSESTKKPRGTVEIHADLREKSPQTA